MAEFTRFEEVEVWQAARELTRRVYEVSNAGAFARDFGLRDQMRRAAVSVMSNIAEGFESRTQALFVDYLGRAKGSCGDVRAQLYVALDAGYFDQAVFEELRSLATSASRQLSGLMAYLESHPTARRLREDAVEYVITEY